MDALSDNEGICKTIYSLASNEPSSEDYINSLKTLNRVSMNLARDDTVSVCNLREAIGRSSPPIWGGMLHLWEKISTRDFDALADESQRELILVIARFTRNLLAGNSFNQENLFQCEHAIRKLVQAYTSFLFTVDPKTSMTTRFLMQTLSNLVTSNEKLMQQLWGLYMTLPEEQNILIRMLAHTDDRTVVVSLVFISNCLTDSHERMQVLIDAPSGRRLCVSLLDKLAKLVEAHDAKDDSELFGIGWHIFEMLFKSGFAPQLFSITSMVGASVNPHQTTLLKLLDSYLIQTHSQKLPVQSAANDPYQGSDAVSQFTTLLSAQFFELVGNAKSSIEKSLAKPRLNIDTGYNDDTDVADRNTGPLYSLDVLLPKVCEAIVHPFSAGTVDKEILDGRIFSTRSRCDRESHSSTRLSKREFLTMFGKASWSTPRPGDAPAPTRSDIDGRGFFYLKRDLVRLLGILCYENRAVQDRVRTSDGITVVMNLCVTDERNPYLREYALFALRNLLRENKENQAVVDAIKPTGAWDENGVLRDAPGTRK
ncbi:hypothetical protein EW145_g4929 [Phellinidium pouzarii]|uniref:Ataxin-10 homolog n=1 Tax=Phellinidium pouzarii TaxID=167371 RepID=A0A4S4L3N7_9AGAM|nr:hypothetical protein EW145_g4929 [Phellinidium pouzarii]